MQCMLPFQHVIHLKSYLGLFLKDCCYLVFKVSIYFTLIAQLSLTYFKFSVTTFE